MSITSRTDVAATGLKRLGALALSITLAACGGCGADGQPDPDPTSEQTFVEDFVTDERLEADATTATWVGGEPGLMIASAATEFLSPGDGSDGDFAPADGEVQLSPGAYDFSSFTLVAQRVEVPGDLVLRVSGPVRLSSGSRLDVMGTLTLVVGGPLELDCSIVDASEDLLVHAPSDEGIQLGCVGGENPSGYSEGTFRTNNNVGVVTGSITVVSAGSIVLDQDGYFFSGRNLSGESGAVSLTTGGDIILRNDSYVFPGDAEGAAGPLAMRSMGHITLETGSYTFQGSGSAPTSMTLYAGGDITFSEAWVQSDGSTDLDIRAAGTLTIHDSTLLAFAPFDSAVGSGNVSLRAGAMDLTWASIGARDVFSAETGHLLLESAGALVVNESWFDGGRGVCAPGGSVTLRAAGDLSLELSEVRGGASTSGTGCAAQAGGDVLLEAGAALSVGDSIRTPGEGSPPGTLYEQGGMEVSVDPAPGLVTSGARVEVRSIGLSEALGEVLSASAVASGQVQVFVTPAPGADEVPLEVLAGHTLSEGWHYRAELTPGPFSDATLDRLEITTRRP